MVRRRKNMQRRRRPYTRPLTCYHQKGSIDQGASAGVSLVSLNTPKLPLKPVKYFIELTTPGTAFSQCQIFDGEQQNANLRSHIGWITETRRTYRGRWPRYVGFLSDAETHQNIIEIDHICINPKSSTLENPIYYYARVWFTQATSTFPDTCPTIQGQFNNDDCSSAHSASSYMFVRQGASPPAPRGGAPPPPPPYNNIV